jgi:hypothetical protein
VEFFQGPGMQQTCREARLLPQQITPAGWGLAFQGLPVAHNRLGKMPNEPLNQRLINLR